MGCYSGGHLDDHLDAYVDGALSPAESKFVAQHLVVCEMCRADVDAERRVLAQMREVALDPSRHASLVAGLLALDETPSPVRPRACVALVAPEAPAQYNSRGRKVALGVLGAAACCGVFALSAFTAVRGHEVPSRPEFTHKTVIPNASQGQGIAVIAAKISTLSPAVTQTRARSGRIEP